MRPNVSALLEEGLQRYQVWRRERAPGPLGDFYRKGGQALLHDGFDVGDEDTVLDVGGFHGEWTSEMVARYGCRSVVFEPMPEYVRLLEARFGRNRRVKLVPAALSNQNGKTTMVGLGPGSSAFRSDAKAPAVQVPLLDVRDAFAELASPEVACLKLNIEGGEYDVLTAMKGAGLLARVRTWLIQFHIVDDASKRKRDDARRALAETHTLGWDFPFIWERWDRKDS